MILVEARVLDSTHLELATPIAAGRGQTVLVSVVETAEEHPERQPWIAASTAALASAYGDSEPEYPPSMVKEANPNFAK